MIIVDNELKRRHDQGRPVRVAMIGAGYMGRGIALQIITAVKGMRLVAISNRNVAQAELAYTQAGVTPQRAGDSIAALV